MISTSGLNPLAANMDYKKLRKINPEAARLAVLTFLKENNYNITKTAASFYINRRVVYDIIDRSKAGNLSDKPRVPKHQPRKTPPEIEEKVIEIRNATKLGPGKIALHLKKHNNITVPVGTIRHIIRRADQSRELVAGHCTVG